MSDRRKKTTSQSRRNDDHIAAAQSRVRQARNLAASFHQFVAEVQKQAQQADQLVVGFEQILTRNADKQAFDSAPKTPNGEI
jgi:copper homeostasis protein CutC